MSYRFLGKINSPQELKRLNESELATLCDEIRDMLIQTVSKNGGHLASNLGVVELTVALHRALNLPSDSLIFDVGHQCYTHKLLTGRFDRFDTLRKENGISGFMRPDESVYDPFITGHASNSLAAAYGIYRAKKLSGTDITSVAVIGDGAMTGGLAFEALNNIGGSKGNVIVVLNDNKMSISKNVGSFSEHLKRIRFKPAYYRFKFETESLLLKLPFGKSIHRLLSKIKRALARQIYKNNIFESLGFKYFGPINGHDIKQMESVLNIAKLQSGPCVIHCVTTKGKGYTFAEQKPGDYHGVSAFDTHDGLTTMTSENFSAVCGEKLCKMAETNKQVCAITAAMCSGTGLEEFARKYKDRFFDVGIAEEYAVTFASGLASGGMRPYFAVYSSFLQRAYDEIIHDTAIAGLPVCFLVDRAGIVGDDGETHQGVFDAAFLSTVPGMTIFSPASYSELEGCLEHTLSFNSPTAIRYPRGKQDFPFEYTSKEFDVFKNGGKIAIVSYGIISSYMIEAQKVLKDNGIAVDFIKLNKIYPISEDLLDVLEGYDKVYFFEEGISKGGICEHIVARSSLTKYKITAIDNSFVPSSSVAAAHKKLGFDLESIIKLIEGEL